MENQIGFKELYDVLLKTTYPMEVNGRTFEVGEVVAKFDKLSIGEFAENRTFFKSSGGYNNQAHVWWEETKEIQIFLKQGVFSKSQLALMSNARLTTTQGSSLILTGDELVETDENGIAILKHIPINPIFVYEYNTGAKTTDFSISENQLTTSKPFCTYLIYYQYNYDKDYSTITVGQTLTNGYLSLEGKTRVKDDTTGQVTTGIIRIPKLKLMSNLSMRLGQDASPIMGNVRGVAVPVGEKHQKKVMELIFLNDDVDSDID